MNIKKTCLNGMFRMVPLVMLVMVMASEKMISSNLNAQIFTNYSNKYIFVSRDIMCVNRRRDLNRMENMATFYLEQMVMATGTMYLRQLNPRNLLSNLNKQFK